MKNNACSAALKGPRRCVCGKCASCVDNDRCERIFHQKFGQQERDYYAADREPRSSRVSAKAVSDASIYACDEREMSSKASATENNMERFYNLLRKPRYTDTAA